MKIVTKPERIPILDLSPQIDALWNEFNDAIQRVLRSGQYIMGLEVEAFEQEVADYLGVRYAVGVNSGTDALVLGLRALGVGEGDEVITTPFSFFATAESISNVGAKPTFVDIDGDSFNLDPGQIEARITSKTKAIMPVHLYGQPVAMTHIMNIAKKHNLKVIEDCAQSFGARYQGRQTGTLGDVGAFSFFPSKNLGAFGDGGLLVTDDDEVADSARMLRTHGAKKKYHNEVLGYNSRLDSLQAAVLRVKLPHIDRWNDERFEAAARYNGFFSKIDGVITPSLTEGHVFHQYTVRLTDADRDEVQAKLNEQGVGTMVYYPIPQDRLPIYRDRYPINPVSQEASKQVMSLPIWPEIGEETQEYVAEALTRALH